MIKCCITASLLFFVLALICSVYDNKSDYFTLFSISLSCNFITSIFSGVFASLLVVILCELSRYRTLKSETEQQMFETNTNLFTSLYAIRKELCDYINSDYYIRDINNSYKSLRDLEVNYNFELNKIGSIDYTVFLRNKNSLIVKYESYKENLFNKEAVSEYLINLNDFLEGNTPLYYPANQEYRILSSMLDNVTKLLYMVDDFNNSLDMHCGYRFKWKKMKNMYRSMGVQIPNGVS